MRVSLSQADVIVPVRALRLCYRAQGVALSGYLRYSWPINREMRNSGTVRLSIRATLGDKCGFRDRFRRIKSRIRLQSKSHQRNARFFVHLSAFHRAKCSRKVAIAWRTSLWRATREQGMHASKGMESCSHGCRRSTSGRYRRFWASFSL